MDGGDAGKFDGAKKVNFCSIYKEKSTFVQLPRPATGKVMFLKEAVKNIEGAVTKKVNL